MLKRLHLKNFTVFADANFEFGPGLNVLVGTNGTGKSHVLKVGYAVLHTLAKLSIEIEDFKFEWSKQNLQLYLSDKLKGVFQPERGDLSQLTRWKAKTETFITCDFGGETNGELNFSLPPQKDNVPIIEARSLSGQPKVGELEQPIFIPAKEVLTFFWISRIGNIRVPIDATYPDLLKLLRQLPLLEPEKDSLMVLIKLEELLGGKIEEAGEHFYLVPKDGARVEANMMAEGIRKFGTLSQLLANGSLTKNATLFWDEPESNLNPFLLRELAKILAELARRRFQIILATHSMSLLKEFHILSRQKNAEQFPIKYFGLNAEPGESTQIVTVDNFEYLPDVVALEIELEQADDLEEIFAREDRQFHADNRGKE